MKQIVDKSFTNLYDAIPFGTIPELVVPDNITEHGNLHQKK